MLLYPVPRSVNTRHLSTQTSLFLLLTILASHSEVLAQIMTKSASLLDAVHQKGLQDMVTQRGGLDKLGVGGHLAQVVTMSVLSFSLLVWEA